MSDELSAGAVGLTAFAALMMFLLGGWWIMAGLVAIVNSDFFVITQEYIFKFDTTTWGWTHLILGFVVLFAGIGLLCRIVVYVCGDIFHVYGIGLVICPGNMAGAKMIDHAVMYYPIQPGGEFGAHLITITRTYDLQPDILMQLIGNRCLTALAPYIAIYWTLVPVIQNLERLRVTITIEQHQVFVSSLHFSPGFGNLGQSGKKGWLIARRGIAAAMAQGGIGQDVKPDWAKKRIGHSDYHATL